MKTVQGDIWSFTDSFVVVPTNLEGVCGRGVARQMADKWPDVSHKLKAEGLSGSLAKIYDADRPLFYFASPLYGYRLVIFPVKRRWRDRADTEMISMSCYKLVQLLKLFSSPNTCAMPLVGCGFGELTPEVVIPILDKMLEKVIDRIVLVTPSDDLRDRYPMAFKAGYRRDSTFDNDA